MRVLYASDYLTQKKPDENYAAEATAFARAGIATATINIDDLDCAKTYPDLDSTDNVMYRGWMLNAATYSRLSKRVTDTGASMITDSKVYLSTHHIPNWYETLKDFTAETVVMPLGTNFVAELKALGWPAFFVKDYVKSLKTSIGSIVSDPNQIKALVSEMKKYRGEIEGGLCVRRVEQFMPNTEVRYFIVSGQPFAPAGHAIPEIVNECAKRIESPFYSIDVAEREDGKRRVVEIGDGQVSDLVGWSVERFVEIWLQG